MIIDQTFTVTATHDRAAAFFFDIDRVSGCMPGVEGVREVEPGRYEATLAVRLGPIRAAFQGTIELDDSEAPNRLKAEGQGRDRATGSSAQVTFTAELSEDSPGVTTVHALADVAIRGKLAQFGTGVMRAAAGEIVKEFAACANAHLAAQAPQVGPAQGAVHAASAGDGGVPGQGNAIPQEATFRRPEQLGVGNIVLRGLVRGLVRALRRAANRIEARLDGGETRR